MKNSSLEKKIFLGFFFFSKNSSSDSSARKVWQICDSGGSESSRIFYQMYTTKWIVGLHGWGCPLPPRCTRSYQKVHTVHERAFVFQLYFFKPTLTPPHREATHTHTPHTHTHTPLFPLKFSFFIFFKKEKGLLGASPPSHPLSGSPLPPIPSFFLHPWESHISCTLDITGKNVANPGVPTWTAFW